MNILHATDFHDRTNSGITFAVNELAGRTRASIPADDSLCLLSIGETDIAIPHGVRHLAAKPSSGLMRSWRFADNYEALCEETIKRGNISVVHIHGIWMFPQFAAARIAQRLGVPTVLTNHGAVQWALRQPGMLKAAKKRLYMNLMKDRLFRRIHVQHAITERDRDAVYSFFPHRRIEVIPNFVDLGQVDEALRPAENPDSPYILFVGRIHPTKGVDILIEAFGRAELRRDWRLIVVGPKVHQGYAEYLGRLIATSPRKDRIEMRDAVWDSTVKYSLMRNAQVTVVPSHTEVISLVNLESAACFTPTITTSATGLTDWTDGGGLLIEPSLGPLTAALSDAGQWSDNERKDRGFASRRLIEKKYSSAAVIPLWLQLYRSLQ